jgi:hypothetical protein
MNMVNRYFKYFSNICAEFHFIRVVAKGIKRVAEIF